MGKNQHMVSTSGLHCLHFGSPNSKFFAFAPWSSITCRHGDTLVSIWALVRSQGEIAVKGLRTRGKEIPWRSRWDVRSSRCVKDWERTSESAFRAAILSTESRLYVARTSLGVCKVPCIILTLTCLENDRNTSITAC